jgi:tetratricopeptide (TPR) repeat protein
MKRILVLLGMTACSLLLLQCAGVPSARQRPGWPELRDQTLALLERATPEALSEAAALPGATSVPRHFRAEAAELAALASRLYRLLYPELVASGRAPPAAEYRGPFAAILELAERGQAPSAELKAALQAPGAEGLLPRVLPFLYLHRRQGAEALPTQEAEAARQELAGASSAFPLSPLPPYLLGLVLELQGELEPAAARFQASLAVASSFYPGWVHLAALQRRLGRPAEASASLGQALAALPEDLILRRLRVETELEAGSLDAALAGSAELLLREPANPEFLMLRARVLLATGQWSQALKPLALLLAAHPDSREALMLQARILVEKARQEEPALKTLAAAERLFPDDPRFPELAGRVLLGIGRESEGLLEVGKALRLEPERPSALRVLIDYAVEKRRWLEAGIQVSRLLEREETPENLLLACRIYQSLGDTGALRSAAQKLYALEPSAANAALYGTALAEDGRPEQALPLLRQALQVYPGDAELRAKLRRAEKEAGQAEGGR